MIKLRNTPPPGVKATATDRLGRKVDLTEEGWGHILQGHPEMEDLEMAVTTAIATACDRIDGNKPGRDCLYAQNLGPARWLVVVVAYDTKGRGRVITAYPSNKGPYPADRSNG